MTRQAACARAQPYPLGRARPARATRSASASARRSNPSVATGVGRSTALGFPPDLAHPVDEGMKAQRRNWGRCLPWIRLFASHRCVILIGWPAQDGPGKGVR